MGARGAIRARGAVRRVLGVRSSAVRGVLSVRVQLHHSHLSHLIAPIAPI